MKFFTYVFMPLVLTACGGGLFGDSPPAYATYVRLANPQTPTVVVYSSFDLSNSMTAGHGILGGGFLLGCQPMNTAHPDWSYNYSTLSIQSVYTDGNYTFNLNGNFTLPHGDDFSCNTNGMTGTISTASTSLSGHAIYALSNLNIDAASIQNTWRGFWQSVLAQTGSIMISQASNASITCTNLMGQNLTIASSPVRDISNEIRACIN